MRTAQLRRLLAIVSALAASTVCTPSRADDLTVGDVLNSISRARKFLVSRQNQDGSWMGAGVDRYQIGVSSLALLSLLNGGMTIDDPPIKLGLKYLRSIKEPAPSQTYEVSLMIMALATAKDGQRDRARIATLAAKLEKGQIRAGNNIGSWSYQASGGGFGASDRSNAQFAVLGLRDAAQAGVPIDLATWRRARQHWLTQQSSDGGWSYNGANSRSSTGSMTVAGIATLVITASMLKDENDLLPDGKTPNCCPKYEPDQSLERALRWMGSHFSVGHNPGASSWLLYYLYGLERAGRLSARRFFGRHDWYREGAKYLVDRQSKRWGSWQGVGPLERGPVVGTSLALLFLSKGLAPVLINKLKYGPADPFNRNEVLGDNWNRHRNDARNMTEIVSGLDKWPKLVTWQVADLPKIVRQGSVGDLLQAPIVMITGKDDPQLPPRQVEILREYVNQGGFLFAIRNCEGEGFDKGFRALASQMYPEGIATLKKLPPDHPVYRSEYPLDPKTVELEGINFGCRTAIIYSPDDLSCFWEKWARYDPPRRTPEFIGRIERAKRIGVNVIAYATGRELWDKIPHWQQDEDGGEQDKIERGLLQIAKIRHNGAWNAAPKALRNLLMALNRTVGMAASTKQRSLPITDPNLFKYPLLYMHGRSRFLLGKAELDQLRKYLKQSGLLFADACCGSRQFDQSFRNFIEQLYPDRPLKRIPAKHEMFTTQIGHDIRRVQRRQPEADNPNVPLNTIVREVEPFLEGVEIDGRYVIIYSKYDISCALERQASVACAGYVAEDALKIAVNIVLYAMLQDVRYEELVK